MILLELLMQIKGRGRVGGYEPADARIAGDRMRLVHWIAATGNASFSLFDVLLNSV